MTRLVMKPMTERKSGSFRAGTCRTRGVRGDAAPLAASAPAQSACTVHADGRTDPALELPGDRKAAASRQLLLIAAALDMTLRERNLLLVAAGFARTQNTSSMIPFRLCSRDARVRARTRLARAIPGGRARPAVERRTRERRGAAADRPHGRPDRLRPNALRLASHPGGLAMRIMNLAAWSGAYMAGVRSPVEPINCGDRRRDRLDRRRYCGPAAPR